MLFQYSLKEMLITFLPTYHFLKIKTYFEPEISLNEINFKLLPYRKNTHLSKWIFWFTIYILLFQKSVGKYDIDSIKFMWCLKYLLNLIQFVQKKKKENGFIKLCYILLFNCFCNKLFSQITIYLDKAHFHLFEKHVKYTNLFSFQSLWHAS